MSYVFSDGKWKHQVTVKDKKGKETKEWVYCPITSVPTITLVNEWDNLIKELSEKEIALYNLKEAYLIVENKIIAETDFKELYGKNNDKVRKEHVKKELSDMYSEKKNLEFSIDYLKRYIYLIKCVVECNGEIMS